MPRIGLHQLAQSGATDGQMPGWDNASGLWVPQDAVLGLTSADASVTIDDTDPLHPDLSVAGGGMTDPTTTKGDLIVRGTGAVARQAAGANGTALVYDSTQTLGVKAENRVKSVVAGSNVTVDSTDPLNPIVTASVVGGAIAFSYLGYNTIGASSVAMVGGQVYLKKITVPSPSMLLSVDCYIANTADSVSNISAAVHADVAGSPERLIGHLTNRDTSFHPRTAAGTNGPARWYSVPIAMKLPAGDYWVAVWGAGAITLAFDTSGSDRFYSTGSVWFADAGRYAVTNTGNKYSIRASIAA